MAEDKSADWQLEYVVKDYLEQQNTDFAIMITGDWGIGKTYYVKNKIAKEIIEKVKNPNDENFKMIFVSLFGKTNAEKVYSDILYELESSKPTAVPWKNAINKTAWIAKKFLGAVNIAGVNVQLNFSDVAEYLLFKSSELLKNNVIVLDDFERCDINMKERLSIIDKLVSKGTKVIVVSNEKEIKETEYNLTKEKVIRRNVEYKWNFEEEFENIVEKSIGDSKLRERILSEKEEIFNTYYSIEKKQTRIGISNEGKLYFNLRFFQEAMHICEKSAKILLQNKVGATNKLYVDIIIKSFISLCIVNKYGVEVYEKLLNVGSEYASELNKGNISQEAKTLLKLNNLLGFYEGMYISLKNYILKGILNEEMFVKEAKNFMTILNMRVIRGIDHCNDSKEIKQSVKMFFEKSSAGELNLEYMLKISLSLLKNVEIFSWLKYEAIFSNVKNNVEKCVEEGTSFGVYLVATENEAHTDVRRKEIVKIFREKYTEIQKRKLEEKVKKFLENTTKEEIIENEWTFQNEHISYDLETNKINISLFDEESIDCMIENIKTGEVFKFRNTNLIISGIKDDKIKTNNKTMILKQIKIKLEEIEKTLKLENTDELTVWHIKKCINNINQFKINGV